jgi:hypothetical protein
MMQNCGFIALPLVPFGFVDLAWKLGMMSYIIGG